MGLICAHSVVTDQINGKMAAMSDRHGGWGEPELAALGRIVTNFAELEWCADRLLAGFISPADVAILVAAGESIRWKLDKLSAIASEALADPLASSTLLGWVKTSGILVDRRNQLIHSFYLVREGEQSPTRMKASTRGGK